MTRGFAFLPWVTSGAEHKVGRFRLTPHRVGSSVGADFVIPRAHVDQALRFYRDHRKKPIQQCVLVTLTSSKIGEDLSNADIEDLFIFGELLAFCAVAQRRLFQNHFGYVGRDQYALFFQRIPEEFSGSIALTYRRRDGGITHGISADDYPIPIPPHVFGQTTIAYDANLLKGLLKAWVKAPPKLWQRLYEAVNASNLANTDSESVPPPMELVLLHGAFERALGADSNYNDFVLQLGRVLQPKQRVTCRTRGAIQPKPKRNETFVLEAWARDFCVSRGSVAHGRHYAAAKPTWSLPNHLLLATYLLPLILKRVLAKSGMTRMTEFDVAQINMFERLACFDHFGQQSAVTTPAWRRLMSDVELRMNARRIGRHLRASGRLAKKGNVKLLKDNG